MYSMPYVCCALEMFLLCCLDKGNTPCAGKLNFCPYQQHLRYVSVKASQGSFWWALQSQYCSSLASRHQQKWKGRKGSPSDFLQLQITTFFSIQKFYKYQCAFAKIVAAWKSVSIAMHDIKRQKKSMLFENLKYTLRLLQISGKTDSQNNRAGGGL